MTLQYFLESPFFTALQQLFRDLDVPIHYVSKEPIRLADILKDQFRPDEPAHQIAGETYFLGLVDDMAFAGALNPRSMASLQQSHRQYKGVAILGIELNSGDKIPARGLMTEIIRGINRAFHEMPVMVVFKHSHYISIAAIERSEYKQSWREGEKMGKVFVLKDVDVRRDKTHAGHLKILTELKVPRVGKDAVRNYEELYQYWQRVLNVSILNKKFYKELQAWFFWAVKNVEFPEGNVPDPKERNSINIIRMITRLMFVWFLKERKLVPGELFDEDSVKELLNYKDSSGSTYYKAILQNLFFATLNTEMDKDLIAKKEKPHRIWVDRQFGVQEYYRYKRYFKKPEEALEMFKDVPFLNGGLFENLDRNVGEPKEIRIDLFSNRVENESKLVVPDELFFRTEFLEDDQGEQLTGKKGKKQYQQVRGLFAILNDYKFTIAENTPFELEVALDPELLGKVFENLLAVYNSETRASARNATGSFYTPREIVDYMVDESLIAHLKQRLPNEVLALPDKLEENLRVLFQFGKQQPFETLAERKALIQSLNECSIIDPACGSGAFPMGILQKMVHVLTKLDPNNALWREEQIRKAKKDLQEDLARAAEFKDDGIRQAAEADLQAKLDNIELIFFPESNELDFARKLFLIENCIFGVDKQPVATQIAKLRVFISLLVEQRIANDKPNRGIIPLPNLETKFVAADSLIAIQHAQLRNPLIDKKEAELIEVRHRYFRARTPGQKKKYRDQDVGLRNEIRDILIADAWPIQDANKIADWNIYDQNATAPFLDTEWMYGIKAPEKGGGFDIVIGNPPYIQIQKYSGKPEQKGWEAQKYETYQRTGDVYSLFYERGHQLLKEGGILAYITSNRWMRSGYGEKTREFFANKTNPLQLIDFGMGLVFESATMLTNILLFQKSKNQKATKACRVGDDFSRHASLTDYVREKHSVVSNYTSSSWVAYTTEEYRIKTIVEKQGVQLNHPIEWEIDINYGIKTGNNDAFVISKEEKDRLIKADPKNKEILRPMLRGRDIRKWYPEFEEQWLINSHNGIKANGVPRINVEKDYPLIFKRLSTYGDKVKKRSDRGDHWSNLRNCAYLSDFQKPKIIYPEITKFLPFCFDERDNFLCNNKTFILTGKSLKYLTSVFNSSLFYFCFKDNFPELLGDSFEVRKIFFEKIPIKVPSPSEEAPLERMTEYLSFCYRNIKEDKNALLMALFFDRLADALVYELYFEKEFADTDKALRRELGEMPPIMDMKNSKYFYDIHNVWQRLSAPEHKVAYIIATMNEIPEVALIEETAKNRNHASDHETDD